MSSRPMQQSIPDINLVEHEGDFVCDQCSKEAGFLVVSLSDAANLCKHCFVGSLPQYTDFLDNFSDLLIHLIEERDRMMSQDDMHELYGNEDTD